MTSPSLESANFGFLAEHDAVFVQLATSKRVDKLLDNQLDEVLNTLADGLWGEAS